MNKKGLFILIAALCLCLTGCGNKYEGYWCRYNESATIVVLLDTGISEENKNAIFDKMNSFSNLDNLAYYDKNDYSEILNNSNEEGSIYDAYVASFTSLDSIGTYVSELKEMAGVQDATQSSAKNNIELYHIGENKKFTFTDSDEASEEDLIEGKYTIKKGVITFKPDDGSKTTMLYIKDDHLCGDVDCTKIFAESDSKCGSIQK